MANEQNNMTGQAGATTGDWNNGMMRTYSMRGASMQDGMNGESMRDGGKSARSWSTAPR